MDRPEPGPTVATLLHNIEPTVPFVTARARQALEHLTSSFEERRPLAILNSGWSEGSSHVISSFLKRLANGVSVNRVTNVSQSEIEGKRELVRSIGLDPKDLGMKDLCSIFEKFLGFQKTRNRRTVVVLEDHGIGGAWVCDYVGQLVDLEIKGQFGLTVILVRQTSFDEYTDEPSLDPVSYKVGKHISLTPFAPNETREFVRWRIQAAESSDIGRILEHGAISLIHELCDGMPDAIDHLLCQSLVLADDKDVIPVTTEIVMAASRDLQLRPMMYQPKENTRLSAVPAKAIPTLKLPQVPRIILSHEGKKIHELTVTQQRITIGRSIENDICIDSPVISRQHATIFRNGVETAVVDLDSRNGTQVNGRPVQIQTIFDQDEITIGYHRIRFLDPDTPRIRSLNGIRRSSRPTRQKSNESHPVRTGNKEDVARG